MTGSSYLPPFSPGEREEHAARTGASLDDALLPEPEAARPGPIAVRTVDDPRAWLAPRDDRDDRDDQDDRPDQDGPTYADFLGEQVDD